MNVPSISISSFARRQTADSKFSHYEGPIENVAGIAARQWEKRKPGYREGVVLVPCGPSGFCCGVVRVSEETKLRATFSARSEGEAPFLSIEAVGGEKAPAVAVDLVLYRRDVLGSDASTGADWEVVSINARTTFEDEPLTPMAMARNFLCLDGGTRATYTAQEFAESIAHWSRRAMIG